MKFNHFLNSHFQASGCRLMGEGFDPHRERHARVYAMPGYVDVIGLTDGTDAWVAPAIVGTYFGVDLSEQVRRLQAGQPLLPPVAATAKKKRVTLDEEEPVRPTKRARITVEVDDEPQPRRTRK